MKFIYLNKIVKFSILIFILFTLYLIYRIHILDKNEQIAVALKKGKYKEAFTVAKSTELFLGYNYNPIACSVLVEYYLIGIKGVVEQNFTKAEEYCLKCKDCSLKFMYQEARDYYCNTSKKDYRILGILKKNDMKKCKYCKKRLKHILENRK